MTKWSWERYVALTFALSIAYIAFAYALVNMGGKGDVSWPFILGVIWLMANAAYGSQKVWEKMGSIVAPGLSRISTDEKEEKPLEGDNEPGQY